MGCTCGGMECGIGCGMGFPVGCGTGRDVGREKKISNRPKIPEKYFLAKKKYILSGPSGVSGYETDFRKMLII